MSMKRKVTFAENEEAEEASRRAKIQKKMEPMKELNVNESSAPGGTGVAAKGKHSLDSDEEDAVEETDGLRLDDIDGQEDSRVDVEDGIRFTPFNLKEEYEEGEFDADGMYLFNKNKNQIKDNWIDDIDWAKIKQTEQKASSLSSEDENQEVIDVTGIYRAMLRLMMPGETVARAIKRLGGAKSGVSGLPARKNRQLWKTKKPKADASLAEDMDVDAMSENAAVGDTQNIAAADESGEIPSKVSKKPPRPTEAGKEDMIELIGFADKLLSMNGEMEIYQDTYERLSYKVKSANEASGAVVAGPPADSGLDMFADETPVATAAGNSTESVVMPEKPGGSSAKSDYSGRSSGGESPASTEIQWLYKWENTPEAEVHGPFTSSEMLEWTRDDYFPDGVFVRKSTAPSDAPFYTSRRIDFELYT